MSGWIKMHRNITKWEWYDDSKMVHLFFHLVISANHKDGNWRGQEVKRGQLITGLNKLNLNTGISIRSLRTCLDRLKKTKEVTIKTTSKNSVITILNYDLYQDLEISDKQTTNKRQTNDKQTTTNKNDNNIKNDNNDKNIEEEVEKIYSLYPSKTIRDGKECQTKSATKNKKKITSLLNSKEHTFDSLKKAIEITLKEKKQKNGVYEYLRNLEQFLNNLPDVDSLEKDSNELDQNYIYYRWMNDPTIFARRVKKTESKEMFKKQLVGGLTPVYLQSIKGKKHLWN